ncbi:hypothetical protein NDA16_002553 [Ustilago loliicola]|nr:hypothetical protein NDA16_002553 [Ustilago loliicola]
MDESGYCFGQGGSERVLVPDGDKAARFKAQPGSREMATVIECIGSGGQILLPLVITKGHIHTVGEQQWMEGIPLSWQFAKSINGWSTNNLAMLWLDKVFDANTRPSMRSEYRLLIVDGHCSHTNLSFVDACWSRRIIPFLLPPHSTHLLQPLDISIFGPLTGAYRCIINNVAAHVHGDIDKAQFGTFYAQAHEQVLTQTAAQRAFSESGITVSPTPEKVLARLAGGNSSGMLQQSPLQETAVPRTNAAVNATLDNFRSVPDPRDARTLKQSLLEASEEAQATISVLQAKNTVLRAQEDRNRKIATEVSTKDTDRDQRILSRDRMISREFAERKLVVKGAATASQQAQDRQQEERQEVTPPPAAADDDDDEEDDDGKSILAAFMGTCRRPVQTYGHRLDGKQPLNAIEDTDADADNLYDSVPVACSSRNKL